MPAARKTSYPAGTMETRRIGRLEVSLVGLGCNNFGLRLDAERTAAVVHAALDAGITLFDTADVYGGGGGSEELLAQALGSRRDEVVLATKFGSPMGDEPERRGASARWIATAVEDSLRRLGTDRIDLYQQHVPDDTVDIGETLGALDVLVQEGKVLEIGCSNFSADRIDAAMDASQDHGTTPFRSVQNHYSLLHRDPEDGVTAACERYGMALLPYFPLASGLLTGKYRKGEPLPEGTRLAVLSQMAPERAERFLSDDNLDRMEALRSFCESRDRTLVELAFSWLAAQPAVPSIIAGATTPDQVRANVAAADWALSDEDLAEIDRLTRGA